LVGVNVAKNKRIFNLESMICQLFAGLREILGKFGAGTIKCFQMRGNFS